jgi:UDP-N-acetylglucosamine--N-acetylmuramyl-(pentapeptide) pyrophosphoryl-undecaprenol N-acetylglucosamine transferase
VAQFFPKKNTALIGIPIRKALREPHPDPFTFLGIPQDLPLILVTGGSLGAERINNLILRILKDLLPHYRVFHLSGAAHLNEMKLTAKSLISDPNLQARYYIEGSVSGDVMTALLTAATLVISRSGSTTLFEIALHGKPSILIPIPEEISRDQRSNAYAYARAGAASVIEEHNLTEHLLLAEITSIIQDPQRYADMSRAASTFAPRDAAEKIAHILLSIGIEHGS